MIRDFQFAVRRAAALVTIASWIFPSVTSLAANQPAQNSLVLPSDEAIRKILVERVGAEEGSVGIVVGVIEPQGRRIISYGHRDTRDSRPLDGDTVFEIGSVTKVVHSSFAGRYGPKRRSRADQPEAAMIKRLGGP